MTFKPSSLATAIDFAPALRASAARIGNPMRREHLVAAAIAGELLCGKTDLGDFRRFVAQASGPDLLSHDGAMEALAEISKPILGVVEGDRETRIREMALAIFGVLLDYQNALDVSNRDLIEIAAGMFALYALAEVPGEEEMEMVVDSTDLLEEGIKMAAEMAPAL